MDFRNRPVFLTSVVVLAIYAPILAQDEKKGNKDEQNEYVRLEREDGIVTALQTAIVRFAPKDGTQQSPTVDLVAAIHVADKSYYEKLNARFETYDVVLYELVAPEGTRVPKEGVRVVPDILFLFCRN